VSFRRAFTFPREIVGTKEFSDWQHYALSVAKQLDPLTKPLSYGSSATAGSALALKREIDDAGSIASFDRATSYAAELERSAKAWQIRYTSIEKRSVKKGMFSSSDEEYFFDGKGYPSLAAAETARADAARQLEEGSAI
jgi:hypothetical protein